MSVKEKTGIQKIELDKEIYRKATLEEGIIDFSQLAKISISDGGKNWIIELIALDETENSYKLINEFGNYVLAKEINS